MIDPWGVLFLTLYPFALALLVALIASEINRTSGD